MDNENHKNTWNNFTKFVLWGSVAVVVILILMALFLYRMIVGSISENLNIEKRVAITPDIIKKYTSLGLQVNLSKDYASHIGITDKEYEKEGAMISESKEVIANSNAILQMNILSNENLDKLKKEQNLIGVLNPYLNKTKLSEITSKILIAFL